MSEIVKSLLDECQHFKFVKPGRSLFNSRIFLEEARSALIA